MPRSRRLAAVAAAVLLALTACGSGGGTGAGPDNALVLYNAQQPELMQALVDGFTRQTGIAVTVRKGSDSEMANQLVREGSRTPADVFVTENSPAMALVDSKGLFTPLDQATLDSVPARYRPDDGHWTGFAARATVFAYNPGKVAPDQLPASILDLASPQWKGRFGFAPSGADFQAIASAVLALKGEAAARAWLQGLKDNGRVYPGQIPLLKAVNDGEVGAAVLYHYYWYKDQAESGANSSNTKLLFFGGQDPGAFVSVSGAGVLKASDKPQQAQQLVRYLTSAEGQRVLAESKALEYTVASGVPSNPALRPLSGLQAPDVPVGSLDGPRVVSLLQQVGLL